MLFGGLRYSTAGRIGWEHINFEERDIEMPGAMPKSGKRKFRQGHPENLWKWLELAKDKDHPVWQMSLRQYAEAKKHGRIRSGVETTHNVWRHSFASYLLAKTKSLPTVDRGRFGAYAVRTGSCGGWEGLTNRNLSPILDYTEYQLRQ